MSHPAAAVPPDGTTAAGNTGPLSRDGLVVLAIALAARALVVLWAHGRFPPADDGKFYDVVAARIASGQGYTWLWPDGVVTYAAHYPVGYPALIGSAYAFFGSHVTVAMALNACVGAGGAWAVHRMARESGRRVPSLVFGLVAALHPSFVLYTPALMTEGVTAALLALCGALAVITQRSVRPWLGFLGLGLVLGMTVLVRPQIVLLAPVFGAFAARGRIRARAAGALVVSALAVGVCLPWTLRNCERLERCVFVSANGGWNLLIGSAEKATGRWVPIDVLGVPQECRTVFAEAEKDRCFGQRGLRNIAEAPGRFLALVPRKLAATFDWSGAPGHYLNSSNPSAVGYELKLAIGIAEAVVGRVLLLLGLVGIALAPGGWPRLRLALVGGSAVWIFHEHAWVAYVLAIPAAALGAGSSLGRRPGTLLGVSVVAATALTHAAFFGDGRYGLVTGLLVVAFAAEAFHPENRSPRALLGALRATWRRRRFDSDDRGGRY